jgi:iron complex outermembrane receptor protein
MLLVSFVALAQQNDSLLLQEVTITSSRFEQFNTGIKTQTIDSVSSIAYQTQSLSDLLGANSQVFIKSYGPGLATSSFRGAGATHTAVLWKGFNLQNPMLGEVDFSLFNVDAAEKVTIEYGGNGALFGSGAVGGIIQLQSAAKYQSGLHASVGLQVGSYEHLRKQTAISYGNARWYSTLNLQVGSYEHLRKQTAISYGNARWYSTLKWFELDAQNNFTYTNTFLANKPRTRLANAQLKQTGIVNEHYVKLSNNQELNINLWYQFADRNIPPTMSVPLQKSFQQDESYRITAEWKLKKQLVEWMLRSAYFDESINFQDPSNNFMNGNNQSKTHITEIETRIRMHENHYLNVGVNNTYSIAFSTGYGGWKDLNRTSLFASYKTQEFIKHITSTISLREEGVNNTFTPIIPSIGLEWQAQKSIKVFGNISRSYRVPTLNERYWITGISQNLQPETGWSEELSVTIKKRLHDVNTSITLTGFNRTISNWIMWQPIGANWAPQNIKSVWSRGLELNGALSATFQKIALSYTGNLNFILSTNNQTALSNDAAINKQLIYVPRVTQQHVLTAVYQKIFLTYNQQYTGIRFISTDNNQWLDDYQLASLAMGKTFSIKQYSIVWSAQIQNLYNLSYQAIADRPMPGRHFFTTITIKL